MSIWPIIKRTDKRILAMLVFLFLGVGYSVYKAVDSLSGDERSPEYRRSPPGAFAIPLTDSIVEPTAISNPRLPDDAYIQVKKETDYLMNRIAAGRLTVADLTRYGFPVNDAASLVLSIRRRQSSWVNNSSQEVNPYLEIDVSRVPNIIVARAIYVSGAAIAFGFNYRFEEDGSISLIGVDFV